MDAEITQSTVLAALTTADAPLTRAEIYTRANGLQSLRDTSHALAALARDGRAERLATGRWRLAAAQPSSDTEEKAANPNISKAQRIINQITARPGLTTYGVRNALDDPHAAGRLSQIVKSGRLRREQNSDGEFTYYPLDTAPDSHKNERMTQAARPADPQLPDLEHADRLLISDGESALWSDGRLTLECVDALTGTRIDITLQPNAASRHIRYLDRMADV